MEDSTQFALTDRATKVAQLFKNEGWFDDASEAGVFAAAYVVRKHPDFDPLTFVPSDGDGSKYNYSTFDSDGTWLRFLQARYQTTTPRICMRNLIIYGLETIGDIIDKRGVIQVSDMFEEEYNLVD